ncbi:MAG TPA: FAD-dependent oxidoreductase [Chloroflexota bacterium]|nr:FAD-dependent oxidoreductase [Chloroflexota bacterium]
MHQTDLLIIGAGPYGLAAAAYARRRGVDTLLLGEPMSFWRQHMPRGMYLRSGLDWHLDPLEVKTLAAYLELRGIPEQEAQPLPVELFLDYAQWFQDEYALHPAPALVRELRWRDGRFEASLEDGERLLAANALVAAGFGSFVNVPAELAAKLPAGRYSHTCHTVDFDFLRGRRCLIVGGRQSAYEWAALIHESGAAAVHVSHRHAAPRFAASDWSWVSGMIRATTEIPGWFRRQPPEEQEAIRQRFWAEGRLKLEPWLAPRLGKANIHVWPNTTVASCEARPSGELVVQLDSGAAFPVDHVILATGYRVDARQLPYLSPESILPELAVADGYPVLDEQFQSSIPGLFFTGLPSARDFGPFFGFVAGCGAAAKIIGEQLAGFQVSGA